MLVHGMYHEMVEWFDQTCGELDDYLVKSKLADNTVILYIADNDWNADGAGPQARSKLTPYELGIRTPMFVRWPGTAKPNKGSAAPTEEELFYLQSDPLEKTNLAANRPDEVKRLRTIQQSTWSNRSQLVAKIAKIFGD